MTLGQASTNVAAAGKLAATRCRDSKAIAAMAPRDDVVNAREVRGAEDSVYNNLSLAIFLNYNTECLVPERTYLHAILA
jgi:hypothetical protein